MDQNYQPYQEDSLFTSPPVQKNAAYYRTRAREILKGHFWMAVLAVLIASLLGGLATGGSFNFEFRGSSEDDFYEEVVTEQELAEIGNMIEEENWGVLFEKEPMLIFVLVLAGLALVTSLAFTLFVGSPVALGYQKFQLNLVDGKGHGLSTLFSYFRICYGKSILARVLYNLLSFVLSIPLCCCTVWTLFSFVIMLFSIWSGDQSAIAQWGAILMISGMALLVVSVLTAVLYIWIQYRYAYASMILAEYPEMRVIDAFRNSASLMRGNKWRLFCLKFSFIGWAILSAIVPFGFVLLSAYTEAAKAAFYDDIANRVAARETEFPSLDPADYDPNTTQW